MKSHTNEFSFILKPSEHGVGVFALHGIKKGTFLKLFSDADSVEEAHRLLDKENVPEALHGYCIDREGGKLLCPLNFSQMWIGNFMNHSSTPNTEMRDYLYYAKRDIKEGEEITADYNALEEPRYAKDEYY